MIAFSVTLTWFLLAHTCFAAPAGPPSPKPTSPKPASPKPASPKPASPGPASTLWENALCNTKHPDITPLDQPVIKYNKKAKHKPQEYLTPVENVFGAAAAEWQQQFFHPSIQTKPTFKVKPDIKPIRRGAPTIITLFYPHPNPTGIKKTQDIYLERILRLSKTKEQVILYVAKSVSDVIKKMRNDVHWHVIDDYATIWDIPNNRGQLENFNVRQRKLFSKMSVTFTQQWRAPTVYDDGFNSAAYNAKAFIAFDAPLRNPFGSDRWVYMDAGLLSIPLVEKLGYAPPVPTQNGQPWDMLMLPDGWLDTKKIDRSISLTQNTGVVFPGYQTEGPGYDPIDITSKAFTDPLYQWQNKYFLGGIFVGNTLGMLNFASRYMQTTETLDANDLYIAREEFVIPIVGAMYPNTVFYQPVQKLPLQLSDPKYGDPNLMNWKHMLLSYSTPYGANMLPEIRDPIVDLYCRKRTSYKPRGILAAGMALASHPK